MLVSTQAVVSFLSAAACRFRNRSTASTKISTDPEKHYYTGGRLEPTDGKLAVFHFLVPHEKAVIPDEDRSAWHGRIHAVAKATQEFIEKEKEEDETDRNHLEQHMKKVNDRMQTLEEKVNGGMQTLEKSIENNKAILQQILDLMKQDQNNNLNTQTSDQETEARSLHDSDA